LLSIFLLLKGFATYSIIRDITEEDIVYKPVDPKVKLLSTGRIDRSILARSEYIPEVSFAA